MILEYFKTLATWKAYIWYNLFQYCKKQHIIEDLVGFNYKQRKIYIQYRKQNSPSI